MIILLTKIEEKRRGGKSLSRVQLLATPETAAHQAPPSIGFSRQEHWSGLPLPSPVVVIPYIFLDLSSPTMYQTHAHCNGSTESLIHRMLAI